MRLLVNLELEPAFPSSGAAKADEWLAALRNDLPCHLHRTISTADLPISLADCARIIQRQRDAGLEDSIGHIIAPALLPWSV
jgi:hypothetical protein